MKEREGEEDPKSYNPISLKSILLKTEEKIIDLHIKTRHLLSYLVDKPLHPRLLIYQAGKSTVNGSQYVVSRIEDALKHKETALTAFVDIEDASDNAGFHSIEKSATNMRFELGVVKWNSGIRVC